MRNSAIDRIIATGDMLIAHRAESKDIREWQKSVQKIAKPPVSVEPEKDDSERVIRAMKLGMLF